MFHVIASFEVPVEHHHDFMEAASKDGRASRASETGTLRFEVIKDRDDPNLFFLNEAYVDEAAFDVHCNGSHYHTFFASIAGFAKGPKTLIMGTRIEDPTLSNAVE